jgi:hypothetical protein
MSFNSVEGLLEKMSTVDTCAQIIDGKPFFSTTDERIVIPAHSSHIIYKQENVLKRYSSPLKAI